MARKGLFIHYDSYKDKIVSQRLLLIKRAIKAAILNTVIREHATNYRSPQNILIIAMGIYSTAESLVSALNKLTA